MMMRSSNGYITNKTDCSFFLELTEVLRLNINNQMIFSLNRFSFLSRTQFDSNSMILLYICITTKCGYVMWLFGFSPCVVLRGTNWYQILTEIARRITVNMHNIYTLTGRIFNKTDRFCLFLVRIKFKVFPLERRIWSTSG